MDTNDQKELFSLAYVRAVAAQAGYDVTRPGLDKDSVDGILMADRGSRPQIHFQAKATARNVVSGSYVHFPLPIKNYDDLRIEAINPRILIVLIMPQETQEWVNQTDDELCMRHCAYWISLKGQPARSNTSSVTVYMPMVNIFNSNQLTDMMQRTERRGKLC